MQRPIVVGCSALLLYNLVRRNGYFGETPFVIYTDDSNVRVARTLFWDTVQLTRTDYGGNIRKRSWKPIRLEYVEQRYGGWEAFTKHQ